MQTLGAVVDPHIQVVLFLAHPLSRQLDLQAQQAAFLAVALGVAELDKTQGTGAGAALGGQWRQAQQLEVLGLDVPPTAVPPAGFRRLRRCFRLRLGVSVIRQDPVPYPACRSQYRYRQWLIGRFWQDYRRALSSVDRRPLEMRASVVQHPVDKGQDLAAQFGGERQLRVLVGGQLGS